MPPMVPTHGGTLRLSPSEPHDIGVHGRVIRGELPNAEGEAISTDVQGGPTELQQSQPSDGGYTPIERRTWDSETGELTSSGQ